MILTLVVVLALSAAAAGRCALRATSRRMEATNDLLLSSYRAERDER